MTTIGIIPLRSGSKRIPDKNFQPLGGKPLYQWAVQNLIEAGIFDKLVIIADINALRRLGYYARCNNFTLIEEPKWLAEDDTMIESVIAYAIEKIGGADKVLLRHATSPLIPSKYIKQCIEAVGNQYNSAFTVSEDRYQHWEYLQDTWIPCFEKRVLKQDRMPKYIETGGVFAFNADAFLQKMSVTVGPTKGIPIPAQYAIDIDEWHELWIAEALLERMRR